MNEPSKNYCPVCNKIINPVRKGSLTGWIFGGIGCSCKLRETISNISRFGTRSTSHDDVTIPTINNRYKAEDLIEKTGMSFIYKAWDSHLEKHCVVKLIRTELATYPQASQRFTAEARLCARFTHPNLVPVTDYGITEKGLPFLVMDFIEGSSLRALIESKQQMTINESLALIVQICKGLRYAHNLSIIHRDLKPENILLALDDSQAPIVKIIDFGIAKLEEQGGEVQRLTQTGEVFGSVSYMSPEQCSGTSVDRRVDIYAIGCIMYELISGHPPFRGSTLMDVLNKQLNDTPPPLKNTDGERISGAITDIVQQCLKKNPDERYDSVQQLEQALEQSIELRAARSPKQPALRLMTIATGVLAAGLLVLGGMMLKRNPETTSSPVYGKVILAAFADNRKLPDFAYRIYNSIQTSDLAKINDADRRMIQMLIMTSLYNAKKSEQAMKFFGTIDLPDEKTLIAESRRDKTLGISVPLIYSYAGRACDRLAGFRVQETQKSKLAGMKFSESVKLANALNSPKWVKARVYYDLAYYHDRAQKIELAKAEYEETVNLFFKENDDMLKDFWYECYSAILSLDNYFIATKKNDEAIDFLEKVLKRVRDLKAIPVNGKDDIIRRLIRHYQASGRDTTALKSDLQELEVSTGLAQTDNREATNLQLLAKVLLLENEKLPHAKAEKECIDAMNQSKASDRDKCAIAACLIKNYNDWGMYTDAERIFNIASPSIDRILEVERKNQQGKDLGFVPALYFYRADASCKGLQFERAKQIALQAIPLCEGQESDAYTSARLEQVLGRAYNNEKNFLQAENVLTSSIKKLIATTGKHHEQVAESYYLLALAQQNLGKVDAARKSVEAAIAIVHDDDALNWRENIYQTLLAELGSSGSKKP